MLTAPGVIKVVCRTHSVCHHVLQIEPSSTKIAAYTVRLSSFCYRLELAFQRKIVVITFRPDSDLEAFSHNPPNVGSRHCTLTQTPNLTVQINGSSRTGSNYCIDNPYVLNTIGRTVG